LRQATGTENRDAAVGLELAAGEDCGLQMLGDSAYDIARARLALARPAMKR
jgi:hypothetical protein